MKLLSFFKSAQRPMVPSRLARQAAAERSRAVRAEVVRLALRDTLARAKVPTDGVGFELLPAASHPGTDKFHVRLAVRRWDGWLVRSVIELERGLLRRMKLLDAMCHQWVVDVSWRFMEPATSIAGRDNKPAAKPAPTIGDREALLDPGRERQYGGDDTRPDFSPTQPMMK